jgi:hypothetical protein
MSFFNPETKTKTELPDYVTEASQRIVDDMMKRVLDQKFKPYTGDRVADLSKDTLKAQHLIRNDTSPTAIKTGSTASYMNPFINQVMNPVLREITRSGEMARNQLGAEATMSGAFGDTGHALENSKLTANTMEQRADATGRLKAQAFEDARGAKQQDFTNKFQQMINGQKDLQQRIQNLLGMGQKVEGIGQANRDFNFSEFMRRIMFPQQQLQAASDVIGRLPYEGSKSTKESGGIGKTLIGGLVGLL